MAPVAEARGWQAEAKPYMLEVASRERRIFDELMPLCRSYRDPAFNKWMEESFHLDVPTVLYWESMPGLAEKLEEETEHWA